MEEIKIKFNLLEENLKTLEYNLTLFINNITKENKEETINLMLQYLEKINYIVSEINNDIKND